MSIERILVAVDDSPPALAAAVRAVELARAVGARLNVVTVTDAGRDPAVVLRHVAELARQAGVDTVVTSLHDTHHPYEALLDVAIDWDADLVVMGRSDKRPSGRPYVGSQTEHLLEFSPVPVLVVPV